jgi:predicted Co/Zn/Cd cation transporter (cation efflux family)
MTKSPGVQPERALTAAIMVLMGALLAAAVVIIAGILGGRRVEATIPGALAVTAIGCLAAAAIGAYARRLRRRERPEWLETQAWNREFKEKLGKGENQGKGEEDHRQG